MGGGFCTLRRPSAQGAPFEKEQSGFRSDHILLAMSFRDFLASCRPHTNQPPIFVFFLLGLVGNQTIFWMGRRPHPLLRNWALYSRVQPTHHECVFSPKQLDGSRAKFSLGASCEALLPPHTHTHTHTHTAPPLCAMGMCYF